MCLVSQTMHLSTERLHLINYLLNWSIKDDGIELFNQYFVIFFFFSNKSND